MILKVGQNLMKLLAMFAFVVFDLFFQYFFQIGWEERLRNDLGLFSVGWDVKP